MSESDLTGESNLVMKVPLSIDDRNFDYNNASKSILYHGTKINRCESDSHESKIRVIAINTGFNTNRGNLIQNILFPKPTNFRFYKDILMFLIGMAIIYICNIAAILVITNTSKTIQVSNLSLKFFDTLTVIFPASLPITMTFTAFYFHYNLNKQDISCISDSKLNAAGLVNIIILDKTGTLTEEGLELYGYQTTKLNQTGLIEFDEIEHDAKAYSYLHRELWLHFSCNNDNIQDRFYYQNDIKYNPVYFIECLATCHSIDKLKGESFGNSIDKKIVDNLNWKQIKHDNPSKLLMYDMIPRYAHKINEKVLLKNDPNNFFTGKQYLLTIVKRFEFSSKYQAMSVIVKNNFDQSYRFYIKGAPEKVYLLCDPKTLPKNFTEKLLEHTQVL